MQTVNGFERPIKELSVSRKYLHLQEFFSQYQTKILNLNRGNVRAQKEEGRELKRNQKRTVRSGESRELWPSGNIYLGFAISFYKRCVSKRFTLFTALHYRGTGINQILLSPASG